MGSKGKPGAGSSKRKQDPEKSKEDKEPAQKRGKKEEEDEQESEEYEEVEVSDLGEEEESDSEEENPEAAKFEEQIKAKEEELGKHCMVLGTLDAETEDEDEDEDEEHEPKVVTLEQLEQLARVFVPMKVETYLSELAEELQEIGCSDDEDDEDDDELVGEDGEKLTPEQKAAAKKAMQEAGWVIRMLSTKHSYPMHTLLNASLAKVDTALKASKWEDAFCRWAATVSAARRETHWFADTDVPEAVTQIYERMRTQWVKLQKHSDEELGGLIVEGNAKSTKEAFSSFLQGLVDELKGFEYDVKDAVKQSK